MTSEPDKIAAPAPDPVFRSATQLVQVCVIAQDAQGNAVTGLRRDEFQIIDNALRARSRAGAFTGTGRW